MALINTAAPGARLPISSLAHSCARRVCSRCSATAAGAGERGRRTRDGALESSRSGALAALSQRTAGEVGAPHPQRVRRPAGQPPTVVLSVSPATQPSPRRGAGAGGSCASACAACRAEVNGPASAGRFEQMEGPHDLCRGKQLRRPLCGAVSVRDAAGRASLPPPRADQGTSTSTSTRRARPSGWPRPVQAGAELQHRLLCAPSRCS